MRAPIAYLIVSKSWAHRHRRECVRVWRCAGRNSKKCKAVKTFRANDDDLYGMCVCLLSRRSDIFRHMKIL